MRGLQLRMPKSAVLSFFNVVSEDLIENELNDTELKSLGVFKSKIFNEKLPINNNTAENLSFSFEMFDDKVSSFSLTTSKMFSRNSAKKEVKQFTNTFTKTLNIPKECWDIKNNSEFNYSAQAILNGFAVSVESDLVSIKMFVYLFGIDEKIAELKRAREIEVAELKKETQKSIVLAKTEATKSLIEKESIEKQALTDTTSTNQIKTSEKVKVVLPENCSIKLSDIPEVRSLRLGMTQSEVFQKYPNCRNEVGANCFYRAEGIGNEDLKRGLEALSINFEMDSLDVKDFSIIYDDSIKWLSVKEFAESISNSLNLPKDKWTTVLNKKKQSTSIPMKQICDNYVIAVEMVDENRPKLTIAKSDKLLSFEESQRQMKEYQRQQDNKKLFKP